jgi:predicted SAM-dependent methyltransferase
MTQASPRIVNLGCGSHLINGMLNADVGPRADVYVDISRRLPFDRDSLDGIFCEEVIEHVPYWIGHRYLEECFRCLKVGASIRLSTPDLDYFLGLLNAGEPREEPFLEGEADKMLRLEVGDRAIRNVAMLNSIFYGHDHRFLYDAAALTAMLANAGFGDISRSSFQDTGSPLAAHDSHARRYAHAEEMSLYIDARKPMPPAPPA